MAAALPTRAAARPSGNLRIVSPADSVIWRNDGSFMKGASSLLAVVWQILKKTIP
jgi:hypothetical protein